VYVCVVAGLLLKDSLLRKVEDLLAPSSSRRRGNPALPTSTPSPQMLIGIFKIDGKITVR
jgi:hypothetical protein